jgi:hypothetical protein
LSLTLPTINLSVGERLVYQTAFIAALIGEFEESHIILVEPAGEFGMPQQ